MEEQKMVQRRRAGMRAPIAAAVVALGALAAAPASAPEIVDRCGTDSDVAGQNVDHPRSEGTDIDTVDFVGLYESGAVAAADGFSVTFAMCGDLLEIATGEVIRATWTLDPVVRDVPECDRLEGQVEIRRAAVGGGLAADYVETCIDDEQNGGTATTSWRERLRQALPAHALQIAGTSYTVVVRNGDLPVRARYADGEVLTAPRAAAVPLMTANLHVPFQPTGDPGTGATISFIDRTGRGSDYTLGSDRPS